ncbi:MAG: hypothetical protein HQ534_12720 [Armatimonadetes bacterium]|nr:hypothetical protein [Armatimonadota bacterium]
MSDQINSWSSILGMSEEDFDKALISYQAIANSIIRNFQKNLYSVVTKFKEFIEQNQSFFNELAEFFQDPQNIERLFDNYFMNRHKELSKYGIFISMSDLTIRELEEISKIVKDGKEKIVVDYFCKRLCNKSISRKIKMKWKKNKHIESRLRFINRGYKAHLNKDYISSIPVLIPHVEGILLDFIINNSLLPKLPTKFQGNKAISLLRNVTIEKVLMDVDKRQFGRFVNKERFFEYIDDSSTFLNRGRILHGLCLDYDREEWSAKLIYMINFLCNLTNHDWITTKLENGKWRLESVSENT